MMDVYAENILDHYRHPRHRGSGIGDRELGTQNQKPGTGVTHTEENLSCGDSVTVHMRIESNHITGITWEGTGCAISQAAMSMLSEEVVGKASAEVEALTPEDVYALLSVPIGPRRVQCALLGLHALKNAVLQQQGRQLQSWMETVRTGEK
jgi:nitrogen fixation protein NifU and related proteins